MERRGCLQGRRRTFPRPMRWRAGSPRGLIIIAGTTAGTQQRCISCPIAAMPPPPAQSMPTPTWQPWRDRVKGSTSTLSHIPGSGQLGISGADRVGLVIWVASVEAAPASGLHGDKFLTQGAQREAPRDEQLGVCVPGQPHAGCPLCPLVLSCLNVSLADHELAPAWPGLQMEQLVP